jgi:hypothetical protein
VTKTKFGGGSVYFQKLATEISGILSQQVEVRNVNIDVKVRVNVKLVQIQLG